MIKHFVEHLRCKSQMAVINFEKGICYPQEKIFPWQEQDNENEERMMSCVVDGLNFIGA